MAPPNSAGRPERANIVAAELATGSGERLTAWVARLAADDAARARARVQWLSRQAEEEGTFLGVLADLAERGRPVLLQLRNGRTHRGLVAGLGADFTLVHTAGRREALLRQDAIASARTLPGETVTIGHRALTEAGLREVTFAEALGLLAGERAGVLMIGENPTETLSGELRRAGRDVVAVRLDGEGGTAYVALASVVELSLA